VQGERWHASSASPVTEGQQLYVQAVDGLELEVADSPAAQPLRRNFFTLLRKTG